MGQVGHTCYGRQANWLFLKAEMQAPTSNIQKTNKKQFSMLRLSAHRNVIISIKVKKVPTLYLTQHF